MELSVFDLEHSLYSLSPTCSVSSRRPWQKPLLCLTFSIYHDSNPNIDSNFKAYWQNFGMGGMALQEGELREHRAREAEYLFFFYPLPCPDLTRNFFFFLKKISLVRDGYVFWACLTSTRVRHGYLVNFGVYMQHGLDIDY